MKGERKTTKSQTKKQPEESVKQKLGPMEVFGLPNQNWIGVQQTHTLKTANYPN